MSLDRGTGPIASLLVPCRQRFDFLRDALQSFVVRAANPANVEILVRFDDDDPCWKGREHELPGNPIVLSGPRYGGYLSLHTFYNEMYERSTGDWLWLLNDDARCLTDGWDRILEHEVLSGSDTSFKGDSTVALVNPGGPGGCHTTVFPMIRRAGAALVGRFSPSPVNDHHLNQMYHLVECDHFVPQIQVEHLNNHPAAQCDSRRETIAQMGEALDVHHRAKPSTPICKAGVADEVHKDLATIRAYLASRTTT